MEADTKGEADAKGDDMEVEQRLSRRQRVAPCFKFLGNGMLSLCIPFCICSPLSVEEYPSGK